MYMNVWQYNSKIIRETIGQYNSDVVRETI